MQCRTCKKKKSSFEFRLLKHKRDYYATKEYRLRHSVCILCCIKLELQWAGDLDKDSLNYLAQEMNANLRRYNAATIARRDVIANGNMPKGWRDALFSYYPECLKCGSTEKLTHDHIIPVTWEGSEHTLLNSQVLCKSCNTKKLNHHCTDYRDWNNGVLIWIDEYGEPVIEYDHDSYMLI